MTAVLSFDLKRCFSELTKDDRWNVLSVLILHANVRNRCYPGTDILARMATNGNRKHALAAKQWLVEHGAIEIVPFNKRVDKERSLPPRQHVYQLTGVLTIDGVTYDYLYVGKSFDGETFESIDGETFNGETLSIPNGSNPIKIKDSATQGARRKAKPRTPRPTPQTYAEKSGLSEDALEANKRRLIEESIAQSKRHIAANTDFDTLIQEVRAIPGVSGKLAIQYAHMLSGTAQKGDYKNWNLETPITSREFRQFVIWYFERYPKQGLPKVPETLHGYICEWQESVSGNGKSNGNGAKHNQPRVNMLSMINPDDSEGR